MLTSSIYSKTFPQNLSEYVGAKYAFNTTSATTALAMALDVLGIGIDDEVIISDFSFPATANVVEQRGAIPVFADVNRETYNITAEKVKELITVKTKAVIFVCALGNPTGLHEVRAVCDEYGIPMIVDAACAIGSSENDVKVGNIGDLSCFSFHPRKLLTSGEGGAITTSNAEYAEMLSVKLAHGSKLIDGQMEFITFGYNYRLSEIQCLMLIKQLTKLDFIVAERIEIQQYYSEKLKSLGMQPQLHADNAVHNMQSIVFTVPDTVNIDKFIVDLKKCGVETTIGTYCLSNCTYYKKKYNKVQENSFWLEKNTISLPCYHNVEMREVVDIIKQVL